MKRADHTDATPAGAPALRRLVMTVLVAAFAFPALAHESHGHLQTAEVMTWWTWEPGVVVPLAVFGLLCAIGLFRLWRHAGWNHGIKVWQALALAGGWLTLVIALLSPVDALSEILFSAHMAQHELLMIIAAPLVVLGRPFIAFLWAIPAGWRRSIATTLQAPPASGVWFVISGPLTATVLHGLAIWIWHVPALYQATLRSEVIHAFQHLSFFGTAALFWWALIHGRYGRPGYGMAVVYVFITMAHSGALGALLTFAPTLLYPVYQSPTTAWGLNPLDDQQLAGLIMWVPAGIIMLVLGLALFSAWLGEAERRVAVAESNFTGKRSLGENR